MGKQIASRKPFFRETVHVCLDKFYIPVGSRLSEREEGGEKERERGREGGRQWE